MKPRQPKPPEKPEQPSAYGRWFMARVREEVAAGRVRDTLDEHGERVTVH